MAVPVESPLFEDIADWANYGLGPEGRIPSPAIPPDRPLPVRLDTTVPGTTAEDPAGEIAGSGLGAIGALRLGSNLFRAAEGVGAFSGAASGTLAADTAAAAAMGSAQSAAYAGATATTGMTTGSMAAGLGAGLAGFGLGTVAGGLADQYLFKSDNPKNAQRGAMAGAAAGAAMGSIIPGVGTVLGGIIGGIVGSGGGGLLGPGPSVGPAGQVDMIVDPNTHRVVYAGGQGDNSFDPAVLRPYVNNIANSANSIVDEFGGHLSAPRTQLGSFASKGGLFINDPGTNTQVGGPTWQWFGNDIQGAMNASAMRILKAPGTELGTPELTKTLKESTAGDVRTLFRELSRARTLGKRSAQAITKADMAMDDYLNYGLGPEKVQ